MINTSFAHKQNVELVHVVLIGLAIMAGISYFGVSWTGLVLLTWATWAVWPVLRRGFPVAVGALPVTASIWLVWLIALVWLSGTPYLSWFYAWTLAGFPIALLGWQFVKSPDGVWKWIARGLWGGAAIGAAQGIWQVVSGESVRAHGPLIDPNAYASALNLVFFPLAASWFAGDWSRGPRWPVYLRSAVLILLALAFFSANSRGGMIAWLMGMGIMLFAMREAPQYRFKMVLLLSAWVAAFLLMYLHTTYNLTTLASFQDESVSARKHIWRSTWLMIQATPLLGTGLGTWSLHYPAFRDQREWGTTGYYAHNDYLQLWAEGGPITLLMFLALLAMVAHRLWLLLRVCNGGKSTAEAIGMLTGVLVVATHAFVNFIFYHAFISILCGVFIGRAIQITDASSMLGVRRVRIVRLVTAFGRKLIFGTLVFVLAAQLLLHEAARLLNCDHPVISVIHRIYQPFTEYEVARVIHIIRPHEPIPSTIRLQYMVESIGEAALLGPDMPRAVLRETLDAYDLARKTAPNRTWLGAEEAMLLVRYRRLLPEGEALRRAQEIAFETLKFDPRHAESILALAEVRFAQNDTAQGLSILSQAIPHIFSMRDRRLLEVVYVQRLLAPGKYPALDEMEKTLRKLPSINVVGASFDVTLFDEAESVMRDALHQSGRL